MHWYVVMAEKSSEARSSKSYTSDEAVLFSLENGVQLPASLLEEVDGDGEEPDYLAEDGSGSLVPPEFLRSLPELVTDEPTLRDSLLSLDEELARLEFTEDPSASMKTGEDLDIKS